MKKGFTLVELLGVIVVLAIVFLITIPVITGVINKARLQALKSSAYGLIEASNLYYAQYGVNENLRFDKNDTTNTLKNLKYKGSIKEGTVILSRKGQVTVCITDGKNSVYKNPNETEVTLVEKETCNIPENKSIVYLEDSGATRSELSVQELTDEIEALKEEISGLKSTVETVSTIANSSTLDKVYPVGSIYISTTDDTVAKVQAKFGGTWEAYGAGRTLVGVDTSQDEFNSVEKTGGEKTHKLTVDEIPSHNHTQIWMNNSSSYNIKADWTSGSGKSVSISYTGYTAGGGYDVGTNFAGGDQPHNNLQPYITVYMYKRTA